MKRILISLTVLVTVVSATPAMQAAPSAASESLVNTLVRQAPGLRGEVLRLALRAADNANRQGLVKRPNLLTVIDYSLPSSEPRMFVFDLAAHKLLFRELCAHGKNSGNDLTTFFSNSPSSLASSIGLFVTADPYIGHNGYSLRLKGLDQGFNDMAWNRNIVIHGAAYVSRAAIDLLGRLGRSWGCPAVPMEVAHRIIDTVRGGSPVFAYYPDARWLASSAFLHATAGGTATASR